jgi:metal-responsive CopG/Arc/MetJ family transcriptional regulator
MNENRSRTTISVDAALLTKARQRSKALGYKSFSEYVAYLIEKDLRERGQHVTIREESGPWGKDKRDKKRSSYD